MSFIVRSSGGLEWSAAEHISAPHAFTTRLGGVSDGIWASLNLGTNRGDDPDRVYENYTRISRAVGFDPEKIVFNHQVHGRTVRRVGSADACDLRLPAAVDADALITDEPGVTLAVFSADCVPILFYDPVYPAIGACHAGWRGTALGIAAETVRAMAEAFGSAPEHIRAAIGPAIGACCYETNADVPEAMFAAFGELAGPFCTPFSRDRWTVDLKGINAALLRSLGVAAAVSEDCTMCLNRRYWSHRHTHGQRGSQAAMIML